MGTSRVRHSRRHRVRTSDRHAGRRPWHRSRASSVCGLRRSSRAPRCTAVEGDHVNREHRLDRLPPQPRLRHEGRRRLQRPRPGYGRLPPRSATQHLAALINQPSLAIAPQAVIPRAIVRVTETGVLHGEADVDPYMGRGRWSWIVPDGLWEIEKLLIPASRVRPQGGRTQDTPDETLFAAIIYVLVSGCAWRQLPPYFGI